MTQTDKQKLLLPQNNNGKSIKTNSQEGLFRGLGLGLGLGFGLNFHSLPLTFPHRALPISPKILRNQKPHGKTFIRSGRVKRI